MTESPQKQVGQARAETGFAPKALQVPGVRDDDTCGSQECLLEDMWVEAASVPSLLSVSPWAKPDRLGKVWGFHKRGAWVDLGFTS